MPILSDQNSGQVLKGKQAVLQSAGSYVMWGFGNQHLESQLEANWQSVQLSEERYCIAVLGSLLTLSYSEPVELSLSLQGYSHVEYIAVIKLEDHQGMND